MRFSSWPAAWAVVVERDGQLLTIPFAQSLSKWTVKAEHFCTTTFCLDLWIKTKEQTTNTGNTCMLVVCTYGPTYIIYREIALLLFFLIVGSRSAVVFSIAKWPTRPTRSFHGIFWHFSSRNNCLWGKRTQTPFSQCVLLLLPAIISVVGVGPSHNGKILPAFSLQWPLSTQLKIPGAS